MKKKLLEYIAKLGKTVSSKEGKSLMVFNPTPYDHQQLQTLVDACGLSCIHPNKDDNKLLISSKFSNELTKEQVDAKLDDMMSN